MEPPNLTSKRIRIVKTGKALATSLLSAANGFKVTKDERAQAGNFVDGELTDQDITHINAFLAGQLFDFFCPDLEAFLSGRLNNDPGQPTRREYLNKWTGG